jgi:hypothetical protein
MRTSTEILIEVEEVIEVRTSNGPASAFDLSNSDNCPLCGQTVHEIIEIRSRELNDPMKDLASDV